MKKIFLFLLAVICITYQADAQGKRKSRKAQNTAYYAVSLGPSLALGDYGSSDFEKEGAGGAKTGLHINLVNIGARLVGNFGISGMVVLGANKFNTKELGLKDDDSYWVYGGILAGPLVSFDASEQIAVDFRPVFGYVYAASPEVNADDGSVLAKSRRAGALGFNLGASLRYHLTGSVDLGLNFDYLSAKPEFDNEGEKFKQQMSVLGITAGVAFGF